MSTYNRFCVFLKQIIVRVKYAAIACLLSSITQIGLSATDVGVSGLGISTYHTTIPSTLSAAIGRMIEQRKYTDTLDLLDKELKKDPTNLELLYQKGALYADLEQWNNATDNANIILRLQPGNEKAIKLLNIVNKYKEALPRNEIGFDQDEAYVSDLKGYWTYSSLHYYRLSDWGTWGGRFNYSDRYGQGAQQYLAEAYPRLFNNLGYLDLSYGYANNSQILYPTHQYRLAGYFNLPHAFELSLGQQGQIFNNFDNQGIYAETASLGKYLGDYFIWYRPSYYTPTSTTFSEAGIRRYFGDGKSYIALTGNYGRLPDIGNLPPLDKIITVRQVGGGINGQIAITKTVFLSAGVGYVRQLYPSTGLVRRITDGSAGITWQF